MIPNSWAKRGWESTTLRRVDFPFARLAVGAQRGRMLESMLMRSPIVGDWSHRVGVANGHLHPYLTYQGGTIGRTYELGAVGSTLSSFHTSNPNGYQTIAVTAMASGDRNNPASLLTFHSGTTTIPEPIGMVLGIFGGVLLVVILARRRVWDRIRRWRAGFVRWVNAV